MDLKEIIDRFSDQKVLVVGDAMLDVTIMGEAVGISPEAPVPLVREDDKLMTLGGAANVAANVSALGAHVTLASVIGYDDNAEHIRRLAHESGIVAHFVQDSRRTTTKVRIIGQYNRDLLRVDREDTRPIENGERRKLLDCLSREYDAVIISDYAKGAVPEKVAVPVCDFYRGKIPIVVDTKPGNHSFYHDVSLVKPNKKEALAMLGYALNTEVDDGLKEKIGRQLVAELHSNVLLSLGREGMAVFEIGHDGVYLPTRSRDFASVTGAGDTVVATAALALASGAGLVDTAKISNYTAGVCVDNIGCYTPTKRDLAEALK